MRRTSPAPPAIRRSAAGLLALILALAVPLLAPGAAAGQEAAEAEGIAIGSVVEPFVIEDLGGQEVDLAGVIGRKPVLVEFWATWCPVCRVLDPKLAAARERFGDEVDFLVVAVGVGQTREQIERHVRRHPVAGRLLFDARGAAARAFNAPGTGYVVIIDDAGRVVWTGTGAAQDVEGALAGLLER